MIIPLAIGLLCGIATPFLFLWLSRVLKSDSKPVWLAHLAGEVPWVPRIDRYMRVHAETGQDTHEVSYVPRQEIAECGLKCPKCDTEAATRGDFTAIRRAFLNGQENEVIKCTGFVFVGDSPVAVRCPMWLAASPNTEHGDELIEGNPAEFYRFTRITAAQAVKEKYGVDIDIAPEGGLALSAATRPSGVVPQDADVVDEILRGGDRFQAAIRAEQARIDATQDETKKLPAIDIPKES